MKRILLLSDTHGHLDEWMLKHIKNADEVWHAGDIGNIAVVEGIEAHTPLRAVWGNIDGSELRLEFSEYLHFELEGVRVLMTHIGGYPGKYRPGVKRFLREKPVDLFISGHSHILKIMYDHDHGLLHLNPGAAGVSGFHRVRTMLRFVVDKGEIKDMEIIEKRR